MVPLTQLMITPTGSTHHHAMTLGEFHKQQLVDWSVAEFLEFQVVRWSLRKWGVRGVCRKADRKEEDGTGENNLLYKSFPIFFLFKPSSNVP